MPDAQPSLAHSRPGHPSQLATRLPPAAGTGSAGPVLERRMT